MSPPIDPLAERLRDAPRWRVLALAAGTVIAPLLAILVLVTIADVTRPLSPLPPPLHQAVIGLPTVVAIYAVGHRFVLRAPARWFLAGRPDRRVVVWAAVGLAFPSAVLGIQLAAYGAIAIDRPPSLGTSIEYLVASLAAGILAGVLEELPFRGALLRLIEARWGPRLAVGVTAAVFAGLHQGHATGGTEVLLVLAAMFAAGLLLGVVVVRTRNVWHAVALHAGWNTVFGGQVVAVAPPGGVPEAAVLRYRLPDGVGLLAGGEATLGAAPLTTSLLLVAAWAVARYARPDWPARGAATGPGRREGSP